MKQIVRLAYTNAGNGILALTSNATHLLWLWPHTSHDLNAKVILIFFLYVIFTSLISISTICSYLASN